MNRNRTAGHDFEREIVTALKKCGFPHAATSRITNRLRDAEKIDIVNTDELRNGRLPYNIQCKNTSGPISYTTLLEEIELIEGITNVVLHKKTEKAVSNFMPRGKFAFLHLRDFLKMVETIETQKAVIEELKAAKK
jgi:Holliday junction resolvase